MRTANLLDAHPTFFDLNGKPLVGRVSVFENETRTFADTWLDPDGSKRAANPMKTNGAGKLENQVFVGMPDSGQRLYTVVVEKFLGSQYSSMDEYWDDGEMWEKVYDFKLVVDAGSGVKSVTADSVSQIPGMDSGNGIVVAAGFYRKGDCPARVFVYTDKAVFPEDGCTSIKSKDGGYWTWFPEPVVDSGCFGIIPSEPSSSVSTGFLSLQKHLAGAKVVKTVCFRSGTYPLDVDAELPCCLEFKPGSKIYPSEDGLSTLSCRSFSGPPACLGFYLKRTKLLVSEGEYRLSWHGSSYNQILDFGTPGTVIVDKSLSTGITTFSGIKFVGSNGQSVIKTTSSLVGLVSCTLANGPIFDRVGKLVINDCGRVIASDIGGEFSASVINASSGTDFVIDKTVELDESLSVPNTAIVADGASFVDRNNFDMDSVPLSISVKHIRDKILYCNAHVYGTKEIDVDWFNSVRNAIASAIESESALDLKSGSFSSINFSTDTEGENVSIKNGTLSIDAANTSSFTAVDSAITCAGKFRSTTVALSNSSLNAEDVNIGVLNVSHSIVSAPKGTVEQETSALDSNLKGLSLLTKATLKNSVIEGGDINTPILSIESSRVSCKVVATNANAFASYIKELEAETRIVLSTQEENSETIHDNGELSEKRIRKEYSGDSFRTGTESVYDVNGNIRQNGGLFEIVPNLPTKWDMFGMIPSFPFFSMGMSGGLDFTTEVGTTTERTFKRKGDSESEYRQRSFYGMIGKSRPKPGQVIVLVPNAANSLWLYAYFCDGTAIRSPIGGPEAYNDYGGAKTVNISDNGSILFFQESTGVERAVIEIKKPEFILCLGYGTPDGQTVYPIFYPLNSDHTFYTDFA